jgi:hypothetical protein
MYNYIPLIFLPKGGSVSKATHSLMRKASVYKLYLCLVLL